MMSRKLKSPQTFGHAAPIIGVGPSLAGLPRDTVDALEATHTPAETTFGRRLALLRTQRRLTQGELAKRLGRSRATVNQYEAGKIEPPLNVVDKLSEILAVPPAALAFGATGPSPENENRVTIEIAGLEDGCVALPTQLVEQFGIDANSSRVIQLDNDAPAFDLRRGDILFVDRSISRLRGDGRLYVVRATAGMLVVVRPDLQLVDETTKTRVTLGNRQVSEIDRAAVETLGLVLATLRRE